jgi:hypothetical protein
LLYENGVARGTAKVPRCKNLKGDWEKRYLVFEDTIRYLNIYKEVCGVGWRGVAPGCPHGPPCRAWPSHPG